MGEDVDGLVVPVQQAGHAAHRVQGGTVVGVDIPEGGSVSITLHASSVNISISCPQPRYHPVPVVGIREECGKSLFNEVDISRI